MSNSLIFTGRNTHYVNAGWTTSFQMYVPCLLPLLNNNSRPATYMGFVDQLAIWTGKHDIRPEETRKSFPLQDKDFTEENRYHKNGNPNGIWSWRPTAHFRVRTDVVETDAKGTPKKTPSGDHYNVTIRKTGVLFSYSAMSWFMAMFLSAHETEGIQFKPEAWTKDAQGRFYHIPLEDPKCSVKLDQIVGMVVKFKPAHTVANQGGNIHNYLDKNNFLPYTDDEMEAFINTEQRDPAKPVQGNERVFLLDRDVNRQTCLFNLLGMVGHEMFTQEVINDMIYHLPLSARQMIMASKEAQEGLFDGFDTSKFLSSEWSDRKPTAKALPTESEPEGRVYSMEDNAPRMFHRMLKQGENWFVIPSEETRQKPLKEVEHSILTWLMARVKDTNVCKDSAGGKAAILKEFENREIARDADESEAF